MGLLKLSLVFLVMIILLVKKIPLSRVVLLGGLGLILLSAMPPLTVMTVIKDSLLEPTVIDLLIVLALIMLLEEILRTENYLDQTLKALEVLVPYPRVVLMLLPAFIGLIPSAGGARFSAPLVEKASEGMIITPEQKSYVNFFYRHITEYMLPIYPNVILASTITGLSVASILSYMTPYGFINIFLGLFFVLQIPKTTKKVITGKKSTMVLPFILATLPIFLIVFFVIGLKMEVKYSILIVLIGLFLRHLYSPKKIYQAILRSFHLKTLWLVITLMAFKGILEGSGLLVDLPQIIEKLPFPSFIAFGLVLFSLGFITGLQTAAVGLGFPIILAATGQMDPFMAGALYACGLCGQMLTPLHLCLTLTVDYFKANLIQVMKMLLLPELSLLSIAILSYIFLH